MDKFIISENESTLIITIKGYKELLKKMNMDINMDKIRRWVKSGKIKGIVHNSTYGVYIDKDIFDLVFYNNKNCNNCKYKDRLNLISSIALDN